MTIIDRYDADAAAVCCPVPTAVPPHPWRAFWVHYVEMVVAMFVGMSALELAQQVLIDATNARAVQRALDGPVVSLLVMCLYMVIGMGGWMAVRRHPVQHNVEMNAAMLAPLVVAVPLQIAGVDVMVPFHVAMLLSMLGYMWSRRESFCH